MAAENSSVIRILKLYELLRQETDENHPMLATTVCSRLVEQGIPCDRRTLSRCVNTLNDYGYEVMGRLIGHEKGYYVMDRAFSVPELKVLIDAIQAASFITEKKTTELINKIAALGGSNQAAILKINEYFQQTLVQKGKRMFSYFGWNPVICFCYCTSNSCYGITVSANRNCVSYCVFKIC